MYCVVLNKIKDIYVLRHIIYDVDKNDSLNIIKEKYYADYNKTSTDEFHLCQTKTEVSDILSALKISHWNKNFAEADESINKKYELKFIRWLYGNMQIELIVLIF